MVEKDIAVDNPKLIFSKREVEILELICEGLASKEIGDRLHISWHTVDTHRKNMMNRVSKTTAAALVSFAFRKGILS